ncbi:EAL domain-containing protein [Sulfurimonas aquatica]|nr:EAL domain-containing protein [Sulfurimonas aquatica]
MLVETLSHLPSNRELIERLKTSKKVNYFLINIDNFSNINNAYGYESGDIVLSDVVKFLNMIKPQNSKIYRFTSDKFVLLDDRDLEEDELNKIAELILSFFSQTEIYINDEIYIKVSLSIGISVDEGLDNITQAEMAIKDLRSSKRNHYAIYNSSSLFIKKAKQNIYWIQKIKEAVDNEEIIAYYQPIIDNKSEKITKYECLARISDEDEIISPFVFLEAAKVTGNLPYVTRSIISQSFAKFSGTDYEFSINITGEDLVLDYLETVLMKNSLKYGIDPSRVVLEMLEDITTLEYSTMLKQLNSLRQKGFKVSIDDFGAESSNLSRLLEIEPDYLKIDGVFIKNILSDKKSQIIVEAIIMMCKNSKIEIIAEYVHSKEVFEKIKEFGIEFSQGYYFGEPSPNIK